MSKLFFCKYMIKKRIFPLVRQKIFSVFIIFVILLISILVNCILRHTTFLYLNEAFIISQCIFISGSIVPFMIFLQENYILLDDYPYMLAKDFRENENISIALRIELQEYCGIKISQYNGKWIIDKELRF